MGRRKKAVKEEPIIENKTGTNIGYSGKVSIKILHGTKAVKNITIHNNGCQPLFDFLAYCLVGDYNEANSPRYLRAFETQNTEAQSFDPEHESTLRIIPVSSITKVNSSNANSGVVRYSFLTPGSFFLPGSVIDELALYSSANIDSKTNPSAYIILRPATEDPEHPYESISIDPDTNLVIIWELSISNK